MNEFMKEFMKEIMCESERVYFDSREKGFFHVCTNGNCISWMFRDDQDFIAGVNRIGLCKLTSGVDILDYTLMDNHVHFLLYALKTECEVFINRYKQLLSTWIKNKYNLDNHLKCLDSQVIPVANRNALLELVAYIDRNPSVAGIKYLPYYYRWGAARYFFRETGWKNSGFRNVGDLSKDEIGKILKSRTTIPSNWEIDENGMLNPECFLNVSFVESLFQTPLRYLYFLSKKLEGQIDLTLDNSNQRKFIPDQELRNIVEQLAASLFNCNKIASLDFKSRITLAKKLKHEYAASIKQISRMLNLDADSLKGFI